MNCPNCDTPITLWMSMRQPTPFRFKCPRCKTKYRVTLPYMKTLFAAVVLIFTVLTLAWLLGTRVFGTGFGLPFFALMVADWLLLEIWWHKYAAERGTLTRIHHAPRQNEP